MTLVIAILATIALVNGAAAATAPRNATCPNRSYPRAAISRARPTRSKIAIGWISASSVRDLGVTGPDGPRFAYPAQLEQASSALAGQRNQGHGAYPVEADKCGHGRGVLPAVLWEDKPALVIWQAGTVDAMRGIELEDFRTSLDQGIDAITAANADPIMMDMQYSPRTESMLNVSTYADVMRWVAEHRDVVLFDRLAIMHYWSDAGIFDLYAATSGYAMARRVHECIGRALATHSSMPVVWKPIKYRQHANQHADVAPQ